jgi:hypothetical protein
MFEYRLMAARRTKAREVIARAKAGEGVVKFHEPYFVQLQPDKHTHLNFWGNPFGPTPECEAPTHTHDYGFTSHILFGTLINTRSQVAPTVDGEYLRYIIDDSDWARFITFRPTDEKMTILRATVHTHRAGDTYEMDPRDWHSTTIKEPSISLLEMWDHAPLDYSVLADLRLGQKFTESNRFVDPEKLPVVWRYVDAMSQLAGL